MDNEQMVRLTEAARELIYQMNEQTKAINALVESNQRLIMMMAEGMVDEDVPQTTYMDGTPR